MTFIKVNIDQENNRISVKNDGAGIPIQIHKEYNIYIPELIFGHLLTSSNYDDDDKKVTGGRNGYGAKLTNIFSKTFTVETADSKSKKIFKQVYRNNMSSNSSPEINPYNKDDFTCITFEPDLSKFKMSKLDDDIVSLMMKRVYDLAGVTTSKVKVFLNDKKLDVKDFYSYLDMFLDADQDRQYKVVFEKPHERWEIGVALSEGQFQQVSYVNAISTSKGGTHVNFVTDKIVQHIQDNLAKKHSKLNIKPHNIKSHLWIFVNCLVENPTFDSQTKENMTLKSSSFGSAFDLSDKFLKEVLKLGILDHVVKFAQTREELKMTKQLNTGGGKKARLQGIPKLEDANDAGTRNSHNCTLILTEGDSAKSLAMAGIEIVGRDNFGVFPLKGKLLNVRDANVGQITRNDEIQNLIKILGLQVGKGYEDIKSLRYGSIMIMTDQDHDGSHIKGLIINFIHHFWPSLIKINGFLKEFITPIIKATRGNNVQSFYTIHEYKQWCETIPNIKAWKVKYYKGLGTSTDKEGQEYFSMIERHRIEFQYENEHDDEAIDLAFNKKKAEDRKQWLAGFDPNNVLDSTGSELRYEEFVNKEFILFSISDNARSIPNICDGLKPSERKILYACFKRNLKDEIKVAQLSGYVAEHSAYHHGEMSLCGTIVAMAQNFVGSNNINLLMPNGQFGTRNQGGKEHASARYLFTTLNRVTRHLFNQADDPLMEYIVEEGSKIEPNWYLPIVPMILVNGAEGIGTGWSTSIPCYNPREIVENIKTKIKTGNFNDMTPWYKGFQGKIEKNNKGSYNVTGVYEWVEKGKDTLLVITELPVKKWTKDYKEYLEKLMGIENKKDEEKEKKNKKKIKKKKDESDDETSSKKGFQVIVEDFKEYHTNNRVHFEVKLLGDYLEDYMNDSDKLLKKFKLQTTINVSNMVLFDKDLKIRKFNKVEEILDDFYELRLAYYERRKNYLLSTLKRDLEILDNKVRFILAVINEELIIRKVKRKDLIQVLFTNGKLVFLIIRLYTYEQDQQDKDEKHPRR
jgi:DNA topoisomerase-2